MWKKILFVGLIAVGFAVPVLADGEGATMVTETTNCSQTAGTCTTTTIYWVYSEGRWLPQLTTSRTTPFVVAQEPDLEP